MVRRHPRSGRDRSTAPVLAGLARVRQALAGAGADARHTGSLFHRHGDRAAEVVAACAAADVLADELGGDAATRTAEVSAYRRGVAAGRGIVPLAA